MAAPLVSSVTALTAGTTQSTEDIACYNTVGQSQQLLGAELPNDHKNTVNNT